MAEIEELLSNNRRFAQGFEPRGAPASPARRVAVLTCMDARLHPEAFLGLDPGDAHVIRNAGGRADESAIRSLVVSQMLLGTRAIMVVHHTDCGMATITNEDLRGRLRDERGVDASGVDFLPFADLAGSVRDDVRTIHDSSLIADDVVVAGFVYDIHTGLLEEVVPPRSHTM